MAKIGLEMSKSKYFTLSAADRTSWAKKDQANRQAIKFAAINYNTKGGEGYSCKLSAATPPVRATCNAGYCCMGLNKDKETEKWDAATSKETCQQDATAALGEGKVAITTSKAVADGWVITVTAGTYATWYGACIEGAVKIASTAATFAMASYMMN